MIAKHRFHNGGGGTAIMVRVVPRSAKNQVVDLISDGTVRIHLTASPVEGAANCQLIEYLSEILQVKSSSIKIVGGEKSKHKIVTVEGLSPIEVEEKLFAQVRQR